MARETISFATCNLFNLNEASLPIYTDKDGWDQEQYDKKIAWIAQVLRTVPSDVYGFQELWHAQSLTNAFAAAELLDAYDLLVPPGHAGGKIVCAGAVRKGMLVGDPTWVEKFPDAFRLTSQGDDPQTPQISVDLDSFSRPVLNFKVRGRENWPVIEVFVAHLKSKGPTQIYREPWYDKTIYSKHSEAIGGALSTIRRTAEATALRLMLTEAMKGTDTPVVVLGDLNDGQHSNTLNILSGQPNYLLSGLTSGGSDVDLYSVQELQQYRSLRDVYYTHVFKNNRESLDHILVSQEFYDNSRRRIWAFDGMVISNDHLNEDNHKEDGTTDHGIVRATFKYLPA